MFGKALTLLIAIAAAGALSPGTAAAANDKEVCQDDSSPGEKQIAACTRILKAAKSRDARMLAYASRAVAYLFADNIDSAIGDLTESIKLGANGSNVGTRGLAYFRKNDFDRAIADYSEAIRLDGSDAAVFRRRGEAYTAKNDPDRAISDFSAAIRLDPKDAKAYAERAFLYSSQNETDKAIADYSEALRLNPANQNAYYNRGALQYGKRLLDKAFADFNDAIRLGPNDVEAHYSRGTIYEARRETDKAFADYSAAIRINPQHIRAWNKRGLIHAEKKEFAKALADYDEAIRRDQNYAELYASRGLSYEATGERALARADFEKALSLQPYTDEGQAAHVTARLRLAALSAAASPAKAPDAAKAPPVQQQAAAPVSTTPAVKPTPSLAPDRRVALVIGNSAYRNVPTLANPQRDALAVAESLRTTGFQTVTMQADLGREALINALRDFAQVANNADWAVVYYAGHGIEVGGVNYLVPIDAKLGSDRDVGFEAVALDQVINAAERAGKLRLIVLDACRDNPFANQMKRSLNVATRSVSRGLAQVEPDAGTLVVYAAKHGETALDGDGGNSPFASAFIRNMQQPGVEVRRLFDNVRDDVLDATKRRQQPFSYGSISGKQDFYFVAGR